MTQKATPPSKNDNQTAAAATDSAAPAPAAVAAPEVTPGDAIAEVFKRGKRGQEALYFASQLGQGQPWAEGLEWLAWAINQGHAGIGKSLLGQLASLPLAGLQRHVEAAMARPVDSRETAILFVQETWPAPVPRNLGF
jgi:hypothetical protein